MNYNSEINYSKSEVLIGKNGKVLLINSEEIWLLEVYQGKMRKLEMNFELNEKNLKIIAGDYFLSVDEKRNVEAWRVDFKK